MIIWSIIILFPYVLSDILQDDGVLVLSSNNFDLALSEYDHILVEFYAPWCGHCQALAPELIKAAAKLKDMESEIRLAKVDATVEKELAQSRSIKGYPTLIFFKHGSAIEYNGPRKADGIVHWLERKTTSPLTFIDSYEVLLPFYNTNRVAVVGYFSGDNSSDIFKEVAYKLDKIPFGIVTDRELFDSDLSGNQGVIIYKAFDEKKVEFNQDMDKNVLEDFILFHQFELVSEFSQELSEMFSEAKIDRHIILFAPKGDPLTDGAIETLRKVAPAFRGKILFILVDSSADQFKGVIEFFGINSFDIPCLRGVVLQEEVARYKQEESDFSEEAIRMFAENFLSGQLNMDLKSETLPKDWNDNPVTILTSANFNEVVMERKFKKAFVEFYAPWCGHCKALASVWEQLGEFLYYYTMHAGRPFGDT